MELCTSYISTKNLKTNKMEIKAEITQRFMKNQLRETHTKVLNFSKEIIAGNVKIGFIEMGLNISKTVKLPKIRTVFRGNEATALSAIEMLVTRFLDSFGFSTKQSQTQIEIISVDTFEKFSNESLLDVVLFFKMARLGSFGTTNRGIDSNLIFGDWFPKYLEKKSIFREELYEKMKNERNISKLSYKDVEKTYEKFKKINKIKELKSYIEKTTKNFDRQMLEDLIFNWEKRGVNKKELNLLKMKRKLIKL